MVCPAIRWISWPMARMSPTRLQLRYAGKSELGFSQEFKVLASNFSAENQKGPIVITSVTKSGGNAVPRQRVFLRPELRFQRQRRSIPMLSAFRSRANKFYYPGGSIGGPVLIPGTDSTRTATSCSSLPGTNISTKFSTPAS